MASSPSVEKSPLVIKWEKLTDDVQLEEEPVENEGQPLLAGALRESLELADWIQPEMLIASNLGLCATVNDTLSIAAPDWLYVSSVKKLESTGDRRSYTPILEGSIPNLVMEFLSRHDGTEYSVKRTLPFGKWFFYEQILHVPIYAIFEMATGRLEVYHLDSDRYELAQPNAEGHFWIESMKLYLGVWQGKKEGRDGYWLRWWDELGNMLPWAIELIERERQGSDASVLSSSA
ncbi:Uma2 family endonuclease [Pseudanabaena sp. 'Roaring Creek']|uniref:Uma2 family endonuclease n=1 Tax=Pseudanabaena sp. 'Roaring Creek' TaxID=1681830 RepID=UPI0006D785ED|nr:Uma2 family endonuclease [Pseudanabaena sp. 'Roaring Creek']